MKERMFSILGTLHNYYPNPVKNNFLHAQKAIEWLCRAQDVSENKGVPAGFHLLRDWLSSYPETTGYIIPTFLNFSRWSKQESYRDRAIQMADWEIQIQNEDGSIPSGQIGDQLGALVFDTGQVLFGLISAYIETGNTKYIDAALKGGRWLRNIQRENGSWVKNSYNGMPHTYHSRVAWALIMLAKVTDDELLLRAGRKSIDWVLVNQKKNGWFENCGFTGKNNKSPYTHTIAYTIRGILEAGIALDDDQYLRSAQKSADAMLELVHPDGFLLGEYDQDFSNKDKYTCLTGNAQMAIVYLKLFHATSEARYLRTAQQLINYLKKRQTISHISKNIDGSLLGSFPAWGKYLHFYYPNWATKFFIDALYIEEHFRSINTDFSGAEVV